MRHRLGASVTSPLLSPGAVAREPSTPASTRAGEPFCVAGPGVYSGVRAVVVATEWVPFVHALIDAGGLDGLRGRRFSRRFLHALVDALARYADWRTGRNCMPGHAALGAALARRPRAESRRDPKPCEWRTPAQAAVDDAARHVRAAIAGVLVPAGVVVCVEQGHHLNGVERIEQWANNSRRRSARSVYALTLPRAARPQSARVLLRRPGTRPHPASPCRPADNRPPTTPGAVSVFRSPTGQTTTSSSSDLVVAFKNQETFVSRPTCGQHRPITRLPADDNQKAAAPRRPAPKRRRNWEPDPGLYAFAMGLRRALPGQLGYERPLKLCATLKRFHELGWDVDTLVLDLHLAYRRLGKPFPTARPHHPAAWLGWALKHLDTTATPPLRRYDAHTHQADTEPCPHGVPGGALHSIVYHAPWCPLCRARTSQHRC